MAKLYFRYGAMNSGKTTALIQAAHNYHERGMKTLLIKPAVDSKGSDQIVSRLSLSRPVDVMASGNDDLFSIIEKSKDSVHCIFVDEAQFLTATQVRQLFRVTGRLNLPVICYGLRTDFLLNGFEGSTELLLLAHSIEELKTICTCGRKAVANGRKENGKFVFSGDQVAIDGEHDVEYESLCAQCYFKYKEED